MQPKFIIPFDVSDKSEEMSMIRRTYSNIRNKKIITSAVPQEQIDSMMATGGVSQVSKETANGPASGVIGSENATPAETVADDIPMDVPEGSFIINAAAAEVAGYGDIKKMIMDAIGVARRLGVEISTGDEQVGDEEAVDLLVSKGEVYIEPTLAKIIGYDVLEKINNRGKREVARRQKEAEAKQQQEPQQAPQPQMAQDGGFVKKKFADGAKVITQLDDPDRIPDEYDLMGEASPVPDEQIAMGDIEYQMETMRRSGDDPVVMKAFADNLGRTLSDFSRARDISVGELVKQDRGRFIQKLETDALINDPKTFNDEDVQKDIEEKFKGYLSELESTDSYVGDYIDDDAIKKAQKEGRNFLPRAGQRYQGVYIPPRFTTNLLTGEKELLGDRIFYPTGRGSAENLVMAQYILHHELIHKSHEELIGNHVQPRNKNKLAEGINFNNLLHLDVHKRTYDAYKNDLSKNQLIDFIDGAHVMYAYKDDHTSKFKNLLANLTNSPNTLEWWEYGSKIRKYSPEKVRSIADTVFDAVDNLPEIIELNKTLNTAAANKQAGRFSKLKKLAAGDKITLYRGTEAGELKNPIGTFEQREQTKGTRAGSKGTWYTPDPNRAIGYARIKNDPIVRKIRVTFDEFLDGYLNAAKVHGEEAPKGYMDQAKKMVAQSLDMVEKGQKSPREVAELLTEGVFPDAPEKAKIAWKQTFSVNPMKATKILAAGVANVISFAGSRAAGPVGLLFSTGLNEGEEEMLKELTAEDVQSKEDSRGFVEGGKTSSDHPDFIKKYFMPEIDYHLETIRSKTVARNQYGEPTTAYTEGVRRGDKIYEIPTYDRKGGILSRAEVGASLDSYIEKYGDFGIPQSEYKTLMEEKEKYKKELYSKDNRFKVPEDAITQKIVLPEEEQQDSRGFIPKK